MNYSEMNIYLEGKHDLTPTELEMVLSKDKGMTYPELAKKYNLSFEFYSKDGCKSYV